LATATVSYEVLGEVPGVVEVTIHKKIWNYSRQSYKKEGQGKIILPTIFSHTFLQMPRYSIFNIFTGKK